MKDIERAGTVNCVSCGDEVLEARARLGYVLCSSCGEASAISSRKSWTIAPMHKSNYMLITDMEDLKGLNNKGGIIK